MTALKIIGTTLGCSLAGGAIGAWWADHSRMGNDFGIGSALYGAFGLGVGGLVGVVVSAIAFT